MNDDTVYKLKMKYNFYHQSVAVKYFNIYNERINTGAIQYIISLINDYVLHIIPESKSNLSIKYNYTTTIDLHDKNTILNISITNDNNLDIITAEYINVVNHCRIMLMLSCYNSFNIESILNI